MVAPSNKNVPIFFLTRSKDGLRLWELKAILRLITKPNWKFVKEETILVMEGDLAIRKNIALYQDFFFICLPPVHKLEWMKVLDNANTRSDIFNYVNREAENFE